VIDARNIQRYIYATNNLRQNAGASYAVGCATGKWVVDALPKPNNVVNIEECEYSSQKIEDGKIDAEVVYCGGGNAVIIFKDRDTAISFTKTYTRGLIEKAPGLDVTVVHEQFDWNSDTLSNVLKGLQKKGAVKKLNRHFSTPMLGVSVTEECSFSGLPATYLDERNGQFLSSEANSKRKMEEEAWNDLENSLKEGNYTFAREFNDIASGKEGSSYIGIVHTDGNGMSKRVDAIRNRYNTPSDNREFVEEMRNFSCSIKKAIKKSLKDTIIKLVKGVTNEEGEEYIGGKIKIVDNVLPFRPIVFNGDDVTFVSHGSLALTLAYNYLLSLQSQVLSDGKPLYGRAGIAIVKSHYPFARAYNLADDLCTSAKQFLTEKSNGSDTSAMDWHFAVNGPLDEGIEAIREKEYTINGKDKLYMRPVLINDDGSEWRTWNVFCDLVDQFKGDEWKDRKNKVIDLQRALRKGEDGIVNFLALNGIKSLPPIKHKMSMEQRGWQGGRCGYFDAIEAMDFLVRL